MESSSTSVPELPPVDDTVVIKPKFKKALARKMVKSGNNAKIELLVRLQGKSQLKQHEKTMLHSDKDFPTLWARCFKEGESCNNHCLDLGFACILHRKGMLKGKESFCQGTWRDFTSTEVLLGWAASRVGLREGLWAGSLESERLVLLGFVWVRRGGCSCGPVMLLV